jgi:hypothetical protein
LPALLLGVVRDFCGGGRIVGGRPARVKQRHAAEGRDQAGRHRARLGLGGEAQRFDASPAPGGEALLGSHEKRRQLFAGLAQGVPRGGEMQLPAALLEQDDSQRAR